MFIFNEVNTIAAPFDFSVYDSLLQKNAHNGLVNYKVLRADPKLLHEYLKLLEQINPNEFEKWSADEQKAFWINAYNAITIEGIVRNYPIQWGGLIARARFPKSSIRHINNFWDTVFIKVMGRDITLNQIEHEILRKQFNDPRIHFVIVCASIGCPLLENRAFIPEDLDQRLERVTTDFINNPEKVRLDKKKNILYLSSIFDWYKQDFTASNNVLKKFNKYSKKERGVMVFIVNYLPEIEKDFIIKNQPKIKYLNYDWSLNEQR